MTFKKQGSIAGLFALALAALTPHSFAETHVVTDVPAIEDAIDDGVEEQVLTSDAPDKFADIETFIDGVMAAQFEGKKLGGATLSVVHDGKIILKKGYGFSDLETRTPVDPDKTLFRPRVDLKTLYLDRCHATGGTGQA